MTARLFLLCALAVFACAGCSAMSPGPIQTTPGAAPNTDQAAPLRGAPL
ncbi:MAG TPA: hypothetical protein VIM48_06965 [Chthoniobacterales bacterium]